MTTKINSYLKLRILHILDFVAKRKLNDDERARLEEARTMMHKANTKMYDIFIQLVNVGYVVYNEHDSALAINDPELDVTVADALEDFIDEVKSVSDKKGIHIAEEDIQDLLDDLETDLVNLHKYKYTVYSSLMHSTSNGIMSLMQALAKDYEDNKRGYNLNQENKIEGAESFASEEPKDSVYEEGKIIPSKVVKELDKYAIGQVEVKKQLSVYVSNHYNSISKDEEHFYKQSMLVLGETGTGKTLLVKSIGRILNKPVHVVDITEYSKTGYVGKNITDLLGEIAAAKYDEPPIVFVDEFDKLSGYGQEQKGGANTMDDSVQNNLLKLVEGDSRMVETKDGGYSTKFKIDTHKMCFIFGGSFQKLIEDKRKEKLAKGTSSIGFDKKKPAKGEVEQIKLTHNDIADAGIKRELVGRIGMIVQTEPLTEKMWMDILTKPKACVQNHFNQLFKDNGIKDEVKKKDLKAIIKQAKDADLGARGLWAIAGTYFADRLFH